MAKWKTELNVIGKKLPRLEGAEKVTGRAKYTHDINLPGMLYGRILRAPLPSARVTKVDFSKAEKLPGVKVVLNLGKNRIRYAGEEVAAVAATSPEIAEDALALIDVEYEELPFVVNVEKAMLPEAPKVYRGSNARPGKVEKRGDIEKGFQQADVIVEATYKTQVQTHCCLESHSATASWEGDSLTIWSSTQAVCGVRNELARALNIPQNRVHVICEHMGGGFGSKFGAGVEGVTAARLAKIAGAPVKLILDRKEEQTCVGNRPSSVQKVKAGATKDGKLVAYELNSYGTGGIGGGANFPGPYVYQVPNVRREHSDVFINAGGQRAMRAPGRPQASFGMDSLMDELAEKLGMDPLELRKKNDPNQYRQKQYPIGAERIGWSRRDKVAGSGKGPKKRGLGMGCGYWPPGGGPGSRPQVNIHSDGSVDVRLGTQDLGTGTRTIIAQIVAEELGLKLEDVKSDIGDSNHGNSGASVGSTTAPSVAPAVKITAERAKKELFDLVAPDLEAKPEDLDVKDGKVLVKANPNRSLTWKQATAKIQDETIAADGRWAPGLSSSGAAGVQFAEVEVDTETGYVKVIRIVAVHEFGLTLNRLTAESQIIGGVTQGIGYALFEDRIMDEETGLMTNPNMEFYKIVKANDMPEIIPVIYDTPERGVVGLGEPPVIPTAAAIANAVHNAIGVRIRELPITPDKVLAALAEGKEA